MTADALPLRERRRLALPSWLLLPLVAVVGAVVSPMLARTGDSPVLNDFRAAILSQAVAIAVAALALNVLMGYAGQISLGHAGLVGVGAFAAGLITSPDKARLPFAVGLVVAAAAGGAVAFLLGIPALRLRGLSLAIVTLGFGMAAEASLFQLRQVTGGSGGLAVPRPYIGSWGFLRDADYLSVVLVVFALVWLVDVNITRSRLGRAFHAIRADESVAASYGVDVNAHKLLAFAICGAMAGVAGALYSPVSGIASSATYDFDLSLILVIYVVVGGLGSRGGAVAAALVFAIVPHVLIDWFGNGIRGWDLILGAALLILTVARHPGGMAEAVREKEQRKEAARRAAAGEHATNVLPELPRPAVLGTRQHHPGTPLLSVEDVTVRFGGLTAVDGATLRVYPGTIAGLIGPNGAGKTTLFNVAAGALRPDEGRVRLFGRDVTDEPAHVRAAMGLGRTFQLIGLAKHLSVTENLLLAQHTLAGYSTGAALVGVGTAARTEREMRERAREAVAALGFERYADTPVKFLSHGQQRIVEIGATILTGPELVLLDEPSAGMSPGAAENLAVRLTDVRERFGRTILLIEHNIPLVLDVCHEVYVLSAGQVIAHDTPEEIAVHPEVVATYLGAAVPA